MKLKVIYLFLAALSLTLPQFGSAQEKSVREQWMSEIRQYRRTFFIKELDLSSEQQQKFFHLYEKMEEEANKQDYDVKIMERRVAQADDATALEYEKAAEALYEAKVKEATLEKDYMEKFKDILTPKQLFRLKAVERSFAREIMKQHQRIRSERNSEAKQ